MSSLGNKKIMSKNIQYYMDKHHKSRSEMCDGMWKKRCKVVIGKQDVGE